MINNRYSYLDNFISYLRNKEIFKNINIKNKNILDFGCGSNFNNIIKKYKSANYVFLVDYFNHNFKNDKMEYLNYGGNLSSIKKKVSKKKFDYIILSAVVEHLDYPEVTINFLKQFLKTQGKFVLTAPSIYSKWLLEFMAFKLKIINAKMIEEHKRYYNFNEFKILAKKTNLRLKKFYFFELGFNTFAILK